MKSPSFVKGDLGGFERINRTGRVIVKRVGFVPHGVVLKDERRIY